MTSPAPPSVDHALLERVRAARRELARVRLATLVLLAAAGAAWWSGGAREWPAVTVDRVETPEFAVREPSGRVVARVGAENGRLGIFVGPQPDIDSHTPRFVPRLAMTAMGAQLNLLNGSGGHAGPSGDAGLTPAALHMQGTALIGLEAIRRPTVYLARPARSWVTDTTLVRLVAGLEERAR